MWIFWLLVTDSQLSHFEGCGNTLSFIIEVVCGSAGESFHFDLFKPLLPSCKMGSYKNEATVRNA